MLALAAPPLHDHSSSHSAPVAAGKTPIVRSKPPARRAPSSTSLNSAGRVPASSSSSSTSSSASSSSTLVPPTVSRTSATVSRFRSEPSLAAKRESQSPKSSQPKVVDSEVAQKAIHPSTSSMRVASPVENASDYDLQSYPTPDLLRLLASLLNQIATANDGLSVTPAPSSELANAHLSPNNDHPPIWQTLFTASRSSLSTPTSHLTFHARNIPSISLQAYLLRILRYCPTTNEVFLSLLVYFDRMSKLAQEATGTRFIIDSYNVHRLVIAGVTVASKFFSDVFYTNSRYARVGGLPQAELNQLELQFLLLNDFRLSIPPDEMQRYWEQLMRFSQGQAGLDGAQALTIPAALGPPASRPLQSMGAFDAFGGAVASDNTLFSDAQGPRNTTPKRSQSNGASTVARPPPEDQEERDQESSVYSETDTDAETDDEPTIRPAHSCASSDTQSLFSNDASEDGVDGDDYGEVSGSKSLVGARPPHHRWTSTASSADSSIDGDRLMASP